MSRDLAAALIELKRDEVLEEVTSRASSGVEPLTILDELRQGMSAVGERYQEGEYFLSELMLSADLFEKAVTVLNPYLERARPAEVLGSVLLATPQGDVHDLGKNILATLLRAQGFEVYDLGIDVPPQVIFEKIKELKPDIVGFSALITTSFEKMKQAADMLTEAGLRDSLKLMIGGAVTTDKVRDYVGADFQTIDATEGLHYCVVQMGRS
jgi:methylmalonyl-CoA mutase cobalamin-binding domain/chain